LATPRTGPGHSVELDACCELITKNVEQVIQGKRQAIRLALLCLVTGGHLLIEDVPGVGKTSLAKSLATSIDCEWRRIQFTPDLLPSDITGVTVYNRHHGTFEFRSGGVFANIVLADEINRASPKTQAALLEAMEERQVTVDSTSYRLPSPFMVIATQNPIEHEGTYPLPESQLDRFLMRIEMGYPARSAELSMLDVHQSADRLAELAPVAGPAEVAAMVEQAGAVYVAPAIKAYIVDLAEATRTHPGLALGMSPRAALALQRAGRAWAAAEGRDYVAPDDVLAVAMPVIAHRLAPSADAQLDGQDAAAILEEILARVPVPTRRGS
jgi:MoxR-like ATPase